MIRPELYFVFSINDKNKLVVSKKLCTQFDYCFQHPRNEDTCMQLADLDLTLDNWKTTFTIIQYPNTISKIVNRGIEQYIRGHVPHLRRNSLSSGHDAQTLCQSCLTRPPEISYDITDVKSHEVVNFIDDSSSIIEFTDQNTLSDYLSLYISMMEGYYSMNRLKINSDKSALLIVRPTSWKIREIKFSS